MTSAVDKGQKGFGTVIRARVRAAREKTSERSGERARLAKQRDRSLATARGRRRSRAVRVVACVIVLALFLFVALLVGDADYHATPVGWVPFIAALLCIVLCYGYVRLAARSLSFRESARVSDCRRGSNVPFMVTFENKGFLVLLNVRARLYVADAQGGVASETATSLTLGPYASCDVPFDVPFDHVGTYQAGLREVEVGDFLGLFRRTWSNAEPSEVCVTPAVPDVGRVRFSDDSDVESPKPLKAVLADTLDYAYVRDYVPGDPLKTIHWKLSARSENYLTRLYEKNTSPGVVVVIDFYAPGEDVSESMELVDAVVETGFAVARYAQSQGMDTEVRYVNRHGERRRIVRFDQDAALALVREMPTSSGDGAVREQAVDEVRGLARGWSGQNNIVVCSANVGADMVGAVVEAKTARRAPLFLAAVPRRLVDRDLVRYLAPLGALEAVGVTYHAVSRSDELQGGLL